MIEARFVRALRGHAADGPGDVSVHGVDLRPDDEVEAACLAVLDHEERRRAERFKVARPRRQFVITRAALRLLLGKRLGRPPDALAFAAGPHGKPFLVADGPAPLGFNVSHSGDRALVAIGPGALGIDIECLARDADLDLVAKGVFTAAEQAALQARAGAGRVALFFRLWTVKEALIKARGCGFAYPPARFEVPEPLWTGAGQASFTFPGETAPLWRITDLSDDTYAAALAQASDPAPPPGA
jgi:4'-phosphopantetheinyl transferase